MEQVTELIGRMCNTLERLISFYDESKDPQTLDSLIYHLNRLYRTLLPFENDYNDDIIEVLSLCLTLLENLNVKHDLRNQEASTVSTCTCTCTSHGRGRPKIFISLEQLEHHLQIGFTCPRIADIFGVSVSTVRRRMAEYGFSISSLYSSITDEELDFLVAQIQREFPNCGYRLMHGQLLCRGHRVTQARIRESLHRVDPEGVVIRWNHTVQRRKYFVASPLSLWHLDGNHKLIRWRLVVHGGVDGYSRLPVYLHCSNNNRASTVLEVFKKAIVEYGLPSRIRIDKGKENVDVSMFLLTHPLRGTGRGSVIVGKSVHNQRIERLWRDVYSGVLSLYYNLFDHMESIGILDPNNDLHIFCLHSVYIPRINNHLQMWKQAWIKHPLRSEHNLSPEQLWVRGISNCGGHIAEEMFGEISEEVLLNYGIDWEGPAGQSDESEDDMVIEVPVTESPLSGTDLDEFESFASQKSTVNYGMDLYEQCVDFLSIKLGVFL